MILSNKVRERTADVKHTVLMTSYHLSHTHETDVQKAECKHTSVIFVSIFASRFVLSLLCSALCFKRSNSNYCSGSLALAPSLVQLIRSIV